MTDNEKLKPEPWGLHLLGLGPVLAVISGNVVGGAWVMSGIVYMLVIAPILDLVFGRATQPRPPRDSGRPFEALLYLHAALQFAASRRGFPLIPGRLIAQLDGRSAPIPHTVH